MNYAYDPEADSLYIQLSSSAVERQIERADGVIVDLDASGRPVGFDVMAPDAGWNVQVLVAEYGLEPTDALLLLDLASVRWRHVVEAPEAVASPSGALQPASPVSG